MRISQVMFAAGVVALGFTMSSCSLLKKKPQYAGVDGDYVSGTPLPDRQEGVSFMGDNVEKGRFQPVQFGYDSISVSSSELPKVSAVAEFLKGNSKTIIVAGFTDERGTAEYNRALGERRAQAVREALLQDGVDAARVQTVSFGEEMPVDSGSGDEAWGRNRRAEFGIVR